MSFFTMSKPVRICIVGAESTGKTVLSQNLAKHFGTEWVPEYGRDYTDEKIQKEGKDNLQFTQEDFLAIGKRQLEIEDEISAKCNKLVIIDSNLLTTCLWSEFLISQCPPELTDLKVAREKTYDLYILPDINVPWVDDGVRLAEDTKWFHDRFKQELETRQLNFAVISGSSWEKRTADAIRCVEEFMKNK